MGKRILLVIALAAYSVIMLSGCASFGKKESLQAQGLRNQVAVLEAEARSKDQEILNLRSSLDELLQEKESAKTLALKKKKPEIKSRPKTRDIQVALKNAGYDPGSIDGKIGRQTRDAIKAFQRTNNLAVDGKVGKQTWALLKGYLESKVK